MLQLVHIRKYAIVSSTKYGKVQQLVSSLIVPYLVSIFDQFIFFNKKK